MGLRAREALEKRDEGQRDEMKVRGYIYKLKGRRGCSYQLKARNSDLYN